MTRSRSPDVGVGYEHLAPLLVEFAAAGIGDPRFRILRAELIVGYRPVAMHLAARYCGRGPAEDLEQVAIVGLINAVDRFDPARGVEFLQYLIPTVTGEILRYFRDRTWSMRPPRRLSDLQGAINRAQDTLTQALGRVPRPVEIAACVGVSVADIVEAMQVVQVCRAVSLDRFLEASVTTAGERLGGVDTALDLVEDREVLRGPLSRISELDRRVLVLRFVSGMTQSEIGEVIGLSQMSVSRMLTRALAQLRSALESQPRQCLPSASVAGPTSPTTHNTPLSAGPRRTVVCRGPVDTAAANRNDRPGHHDDRAGDADHDDEPRRPDTDATLSLAAAQGCLEHRSPEPLGLPPLHGVRGGRS